MSIRVAVLAGLVTFAVFVAVNAYVLLDAESLPKIQGIVIPEARGLDDFVLRSHHDKPFTESDLKNRWHLVSYGFTDCPDICPTTLDKLARVEEKLQQLGQYEDLQILFYTVDPKRDTTERLSQYVAFFSEDFIGLTWGLELATNHLPFEQSLGIISSIDPLPENQARHDYKGYSVSHGVVLYLLNPEGKLQAILKPDVDSQGLHYFSVDKIYRDYLTIRSYFG